MERGRLLRGWPWRAGGAGDAGEASLLTAYEYPRVYGHHADTRCARRHSSTTIAKLFLFSLVMISFCVLMYIPVYSRVNGKHATVSGWSADTNRDTRVYVQPGNTTLVHDVRSHCPAAPERPLFLLVVVCSSSGNFRQRQVIRETWGNYSNYLELVRVETTIREQYKHYQYNYNLMEYDADSSSEGGINRTKVFQLSNVKEGHRDEISKEKSTLVRKKRGFANLEGLIPNLAEALKRRLPVERSDGAQTEEVRFEETSEQNALPEFDMNKVIGDAKSEEDYYDEESNVMKIPSRGFEETPDVGKIIRFLKKSAIFKGEGSDPGKTDNKVDSDRVDSASSEEKVYKVVFLLGLPPGPNGTDVQSGIDEEASKYGDIIQERFVDSYNNLTLKSVMMLKWLVTHCNETVRYVLKTDDDVYVNVPRLRRVLEARAERARDAVKFWTRGRGEYYVAGLLIRNARPVSDTDNKWYAPHYMYSGRVYPRYLSGTGYVMTGSAVAPLYRAALVTPLFHLEDVFITGMCAARSVPRLRVEPEDGFGYTSSAAPDGPVCHFYTKSTVHRASEAMMRSISRRFTDMETIDRCERKVLQSKRVELLLKQKSGSTKGVHARLAKLSRFHDVLSVKKVASDS